MSGFLNNLQEHHQQHRERREERREARHERHGRGGDYDDRDDDYGRPQHRGQQRYEDGDGYGARGPQSFGGPGRGGPGTFASQGGLDRGDFASDADIEQMVTSSELGGRQEREGYGYGGAGGERGRYDAPSGPPPGGRANEYGRYDGPTGPPPGRGYGERANEYDRYDAPTRPPPGRGYGGRANEHDRYDAPTRPPPGRGYQDEQSHQQGHGTGGTYASGYGGGPDRQSQYGAQQTQGRSQYEASQGPPPGHGKSQGNVPSGGFSASRDQEEQYGSGYGGTSNDRSEHRGEAASYYDQQGAPGQGDRYARLADMAQEHGEDAELYRRATQGLQAKIRSQAQSGRQGDDEDYKAHVDAHRKAYGGDDHGPMDADAIGAAAAMEAFKQTAAGARSSNAPAGAFKAGKASGDPSTRPGRVAQEEEEEEGAAGARAGGSGGLQDKLMALAMSHAGKLFDKKNGGGGDKSQDKAQAMQSAAATAMQMFTQYQSKGKLESGDMQKVIGLAMNLL